MNIRRIYEVAVPVVGVAVVLTLSATFRDRLPSPMAMHWGTSGPDGAGPLWLVTGFAVGFTVLLGLGSVLAASGAPSRFVARGLVATGHGFTGLLVGAHAVTLWANLDAPTWEAAEPLGPAFLGVVVLALPLAALGWLAPADRPDPEPRRHAPIPVDVAPGEAVIWVGAARAHLGQWLVVLAAGGALLTWFALPAEAGRWVLLTALGVSVVLLALIGTRVTIGPTGVRATVGRLPWPVVRVPLEEVEGVEVIEVEPLAYGGWGYRVAPGVRAIVVRRGEGLRIQRRGRSDLVVTVDGARTGAGVLLAHLEHAR